MMQASHQSVDLLLRSGAGDRHAAEQLALALGDFPEALAMASAFLRETRDSLQSYLESFLALQDKLLGRGTLSPDYPILVAASLSLRHLDQEEWGSVFLMILTGFLEREKIPVQIFSDWGFLSDVSMPEVVTDPEACREALCTLERYALIQLEEESIRAPHPLVQAAARRLIARDGQQVLVELLLHKIEALFSFDFHDEASWPESAQLLPHTLRLIRWMEGFGVVRRDLGFYLMRAGSYLIARENFARAKPVFLQAVPHILTRGQDIPTLYIDLFENLSAILRNQSDLTGALDLYRGTIQLAERAYGARHVRVGALFREMAIILVAMDKDEEARACLERSLDTEADPQTTPAKELQDRAESAACLGRLLLDADALTEAKARFTQALTLYEACGNPKPERVGYALGYLGFIALKENDFPLARDFYERAVKTIEEAHGPDFPGLGPLLGDLSFTLSELEEYEPARVCCERALAFLAASKGEDSHSYALMLNQLGLILAELGEIDAARKQLQEALTLLRDTAGEEHPDTLTVKENLESLDEEEE